MCVRTCEGHTWAPAEDFVKRANPKITFYKKKKCPHIEKKAQHEEKKDPHMDYFTFHLRTSVYPFFSPPPPLKSTYERTAESIQKY